MPFPFSIVVYEPGAGGIPTTTNPQQLGPRVESYSDSILSEFGHESMRLTLRTSREEAVDWTNRLMSAVEVYTPSGLLRFSGFLNEVTIPELDASVSLTDMANVLIVRYADPEGKQGTVTVTNAASIARYGRKERALNESISLQADATNRASMVLAQIAQPPNKEPVSAEKADGGFTVHLSFCGWAETLKWLTTASTTETTAVTSTQVTTLITAYNAVNNFFDTASASIVSTAFSATEFCPPDTTYYERIAKLLAFGNSTQQRVAWGFYGRAITIGVSASAAPDTITYLYSKRAGALRDTNQNLIPPWDWQPNVMVQNVDVIEAPAPSTQIASLTRKYIRRATLEIDKAGNAHGKLEPDDVDKLPEMLAKPVSVTSGVSSRHATIEARIRDAIRARTISTDNASVYNPVTGVILPAAGGTGVANTGTINTGGGDIVNTGGAPIDLGTGSGIGGAGSSGVTTAGGTAPRMAEFSGTNALVSSTFVKSGAGVFTLSVASTQTLTISGSSGGTLALGGFTLTLDGSLRASGTGAATGDVLEFDGTRFAPSAPTIYAPTNATYITQTSNATLTNEQALGALATGLLKNTTTTGVLSIATASDLPNHASRHADGGADEVALDASQTTTGTFSTARLGSGTADSTKYLSGDSTWQTLSTGAPTNATYITQTSNGTLSAEQAIGGLATGFMKVTTSTGVISSIADPLPAANGGTGINNSTRTITINTNPAVFTFSGAFTLTIPKTGTAVVGTGAANKIGYWTGTNDLSSDTNLHWDATNDFLGIVTATPGYDIHVRTTLPTIMSEDTGTGVAQHSVKNTNRTYSMAVQGSNFVIIDNTASANRLVMTTSGNFGIGNITPGHPLEVSGNAKINAALSVGTATPGASGSIKSQGQIIAGTSFQSSLGVPFDIGGYTALAGQSLAGYLSCNIGGVTRLIAILS